MRASGRVGQGRLRWRRAVCSLAAVAGLWCAGALPAAAQSAALPSVRIVSGVPITPSAAQTWYSAQGTAATTSTDGLCRDYGSASGHQAAGICPTGGRPAAPEIVELARALKDDPNLIYEYMRNTVDTEFIFGAHRGPLGVIIDKSGTAFDQAELMVALLNQAHVENPSLNFSPKYRYGTITLTGTQFQSWTGLTDAQAACRLLATGGIPASVTGTGGSATTTDCTSATGTVASVNMSHVWVEATVGGTAYQFDPSFKPYQHKTGLTRATLQSSMTGFTAGQPLSTATATMTTGSDGSGTTVPYVKGLDKASLESKLHDYAAGLATRLRGSDLQGADMTDVVGGRIITPATRPTGGWTQASLSYADTGSTTWTTGVPDIYRATVNLTGTASTTGDLVSATFFADEIYGRRLEIGATPVSGTAEVAGGTAQMWKPVLYLDKVAIQTGAQRAAPGDLNIPMTITVNHPFAANAAGGTANGTYGDAAISKATNFIQTAQIVLGWGHTSPALASKWEREQGVDQDGQVTFWAPPDSWSPYGDIPQPEGDLSRARIGASYLAQFSRATDLHAELADSRPTILHVTGVVTGVANSTWMPLSPPAPGADNPPNGFDVSDEVSSIDVETSFGLTTRTTSSTATLDRRAAIHAIAATGASLEGSVVEQMTDTPDGASTARRFAWSTAPTSADTPDTTTRKFYKWSSANATTGNTTGLTLFDNSTSGTSASFGGLPAINSTNITRIKGALSSTVTNYATASGVTFEVTATNESFGGAGHRVGSEYVTTHPATGNDWYDRYPSLQRGGALIADAYDSNHEPVQIAHVITRYLGATKGGGGAVTSQNGQFSPQEAAQALKDRFVDRSSVEGVDLMGGTASYDTGTLVSAGQGEFPFKLDLSFAIKGGAMQNPPAHSPPNDGGVALNMAGSATVSGSGLEPMGQSRIEASASTLAAFLAMQDAWRTSTATTDPSTQQHVTGALIANWWQDRLVYNVVTIAQGAGTEQFVRVADETTLIPSGGGADRVSLTGSRTVARPTLANPSMAGHNSGGTPTQTESIEHVWDYSGVVIGWTGAHGDTKTYSYWSMSNDNITTNYSLWTGFRLNTWTFPQGVTVTLHYGGGIIIPDSVSNNVGVSVTTPSWTGTGCAISPYEDFVDATGAHHKATFRAPTSRSLTQRPYVACPVQAVYDPTDQTTPAIQYGFDSLGRVNQASDAIAIRTPTARGPHIFFIADGYRGERQDPITPTAGHYVVESMPAGGASVTTTLRATSTSVTQYAATQTRNIDELGNVTLTYRDGRGRVIEHLYPEGDQDLFNYDGNNNFIQITKVGKPCPTPANGCTSLSNIINSATWETTWNKVATITDGNGNTTTFNYVATGTNGASQFSSVVRPTVAAPGGGTAAPTYSFTYNSFGQPLTATDADGVVTQNTYDATSHFLTQTAVDPSGVNSITQFTNNTLGDPTAITDPRSNVSNVTYDALRRKLIEISPDPDGAGALLRPAVKHTYDLAGRETQTDKGRTTTSTGSDFAALSTVGTTYDAAGNKVFVKTQTGRTQFAYDGLNREVCAAQRMDVSVADGSLPTNACSLTAAEDTGHPGKTAAGAPVDRITQTTWDPAGQKLMIVQAASTSAQRTYSAQTYGADGEALTIQDANWNLTTYGYDPFNRLVRTMFPTTARPSSAGAATSNTSDYEAYGYDANGNRVTLRKRDGTTNLAYCYDALNRQTVKYLHTVTAGTCPSATGSDVTTVYTLGGKPVSALFASGDGITYAYDSADRLTGETTAQGGFSRQMTYAYDKANNRIKVSWPGTPSFFAGYVYDPLNRLTRVCQNLTDDASGAACTGASDVSSTATGITATGRLATYAYDDLGHRTSISRANSTSTTYAFSNPELMTGLTQDLAGTTNDQSWGYGYNQAAQVVSRSGSNSLYEWTNRQTVQLNKTFDGLNRDAGIASVGSQPCSTTSGYDCNGNVVNDGTYAYTYDLENRLLTAATISPSATVLTLVYDPNGRINKLTNASSVATGFLYDGDRLSAEYDGSGVLQKRYVHGPGTDEPLIWYDVNVSGGTQARHWLHMDAQGSVVAWSGDTGSSVTIQAYGPYGEPQSWTGSRFAYTGQLMLPEAQLYHYKARAYDPKRGVFLQTDPVGYKDDLDLYTYVGDDPMDKADPTGNTGEGSVALQVLERTTLREALTAVGGDNPVGIFLQVAFTPTVANAGEMQLVQKANLTWDLKRIAAGTYRADGHQDPNAADKKRQQAQRELRNQRREDRSRGPNGNGQKKSGDGFRNHADARKGPGGQRPGGPDRSNNRERNRGIDEEHSRVPKGQPNQSRTF